MWFDVSQFSAGHQAFGFFPNFQDKFKVQPVDLLQVTVMALRAYPSHCNGCFHVAIQTWKWPFRGVEQAEDIPTDERRKDMKSDAT